MTTNTEEQLNILTTEKEGIQELLGLSPARFALLLANAEPKADLLRCDAVRQWLYTKPNDMYFAVTLAYEMATTYERLAILCVICASAHRRMVPPQLDAAELALKEAMDFITKVMEGGDKAWAARIESAVENELAQVLRMQGKFREAADVNFRTAEKLIRTPFNGHFINPRLTPS